MLLINCGKYQIEGKNKVNIGLNKLLLTSKKKLSLKKKMYVYNRNINLRITA